MPSLKASLSVSYLTHKCVDMCWSKIVCLDLFSKSLVTGCLTWTLEDTKSCPCGALSPSRPHHPGQPVIWWRPSDLKTFCVLYTPGFIGSSCQSVRPSCRPSVCPPPHPAVRPSIHPSICSAVHPSISLFLHPSVPRSHCRSVCLYINAILRALYCHWFSMLSSHKIVPAIFLSSSPFVVNNMALLSNLNAVWREKRLQSNLLKRPPVWRDCLS